MAKLTDKFFNRVIEGRLELDASEQAQQDASAVKAVEGASSGTPVSLLGLNSQGELVKGSSISGNFGVGGNLNVTGNVSGDNITGNSIIENMEGYGFLVQQTGIPTNLNVNIVYAGAVKNGNKLTLVLFGKLTRTGTLSSSYIDFGLAFIVPKDSVGNKIYPYSVGSLEAICDNKIIPFFSGYSTYTNRPILMQKQDLGGTNISRLWLNIYALDTLTENTETNFRYEATFLLSDNMAPSGE